MASAREIIMSKKSSSSEVQVKKVREKVITRAHAEKRLTAGADPNTFVKHPNPHVRRKAWVKMGRPLPEDMDEQNIFLATLQGTETPKDATALVGFYQLIRQRILKEVPFKPFGSHDPVAISAEDAEYLKGEPVPPTVLVPDVKIEG